MIISDRIWDIIEPATARFEGVSRVDIERGLMAGDYEIFERGSSVAVTAHFGSSIRIGLAGGHIDELLEIERDIYDHAVAHGYENVEIIGRPGWERQLPGYERVAVILRKEVHRYGLH